MSDSLKTIFALTMIAALGCGFLHHLTNPSLYNFERLHIFLFNLCSGGTMLIYFSEDQPRLSRQGRLFFLLALAFAICAFANWYLPTLLIPLLLAIIVERVRVACFGSCLPLSLFSASEPVSRKFHQAALLCLSLGLLLCVPVIANSVYGHWLVIDKLKLDTFFLGFSFPVSLISMSVIFSLMKRPLGRSGPLWQEVAFWTINVGVIIFFLFILAQWFVPQVLIAFTLMLAVLLVLLLYARLGRRLQQKAFLTSGIIFLLITSLSGIAYILLAFSPYYQPQYSQPLLRLHAFTALYGWNLSGLAVISRHDDFPLQLHSKNILLLHWLTVLILCPLGYFYAPAALIAVLFYSWLIVSLLFKQGPRDHALQQAEERLLHQR